VFVGQYLWVLTAVHRAWYLFNLHVVLDCLNQHHCSWLAVFRIVFFVNVIVMASWLDLL